MKSQLFDDAPTLPAEPWQEGDQRLRTEHAQWSFGLLDALGADQLPEAVHTLVSERMNERARHEEGRRAGRADAVLLASMDTPVVLSSFRVIRALGR